MHTGTGDKKISKMMFNLQIDIQNDIKTQSK